MFNPISPRKETIMQVQAQRPAESGNRVTAEQPRREIFTENPVAPNRLDNDDPLLDAVWRSLPFAQMTAAQRNKKRELWRLAQESLEVIDDQTAEMKEF